MKTKKMSRCVSLMFALMLIIIVMPTASAVMTTRYVKQTATGTGDGSTWADASNNLQAMINLSVDGDQIWVAKGAYKPIYTALNWNGVTTGTTNGNRDNAFMLKEGVKIYGGFSGNTDETINNRNIKVNETILSGDLNGDDSGTENKGDNAYHVVISIRTTNETILDGVTITGGCADGSSYVTINTRSIQKNYGGGIFNTDSLATFENVTVSGNSAISSGGGIFNEYSSSPTFKNVTISGNVSELGGGVFNYSSPSPIFENVTISGNTARNYGGGIVNRGSSLRTSSPIITNSTISGNTAQRSGGGIVNELSASPIITNVTISGNLAKELNGGGVHNSESSPTITNVTISGNSALNNGSGIYNYSSSNPIINNSIIWGNQKSPSVFNTASVSAPFSVPAPVYNYSIVEDVTAAGVTDTDPKFINHIDPKGIPNTIGDYGLLSESPAIDAGDNALYIAARGAAFDDPTEVDIKGKPRFVNSVIDIGAYEFQNSRTFYVKQIATGTGDGSTWADASDDLQAMINLSIAGDQIFMAAGTYIPMYTADGWDGITTTEDETPGNRDNAFMIKDEVSIYGGFSGDGSEATVYDRDIENNETILSGDLGIKNDVSDNSYHVVIAFCVSSETVLDGLTITGGNGNVNGRITVGQPPEDLRYNYGGGMYIVSSSPQLANMKIHGNNSALGGGVYMTSSSPQLTNMKIQGNTSTSEGGGVYIISSSPKLTNMKIQDNIATLNGGGVYIYDSSPTFENVEISGNSSDAYGGNGGGGIYSNQSDGTYINTQISGNSASLKSGGGIFITTSANAGTRELTFVNVTISGNSARNSGGIHCYGNFLRINNSIIWGNKISTTTLQRPNLYYGKPSNSTDNAVISYSILENYDGDITVTDSLTDNPMFVDYIDPSEAGWTATAAGDYRIKVNSPALDNGVLNLYKLARGESYFESTETDLAGNSRLIGSEIDMGAYEGGVITAQLESLNNNYEVILEKHTNSDFSVYVRAKNGNVTLDNMAVYVAQYSGNKLTALTLPIAKKESGKMIFNISMLPSSYKIMVWDGMTPLIKPVTHATIWDD